MHRYLTLLRSISTSASPPPKALILPRARTPSEKQFESWITTLKPGFTPSDVDSALKAQHDPDMALDIFRWTSQRPTYKHNHQTYLTIFQLLCSSRRFKPAETLLDELISGACTPDLNLYNAMIKFCCSKRHLHNRAFDVLKKMLKSEDAKPTLETYSMLFHSLSSKFDRLPAGYVYLHSLKSLFNRMKVTGVMPDIFVLNVVIKAYSKCKMVDEAVRAFREMKLYGCEPNAFSYNHVIYAACEKEMVDLGLSMFKEMKEKGLEPRRATYMILVCSLAMERRFEEGVEILFDMLENSLSPDLLTYRAVLEEMCRDGRDDEAYDLLEKFRNKDSDMNQTKYSKLLDNLHSQCGR